MADTVESEKLPEKLSPSPDNTEVEHGVDELQEALEGYVLDPAKYPNNAAGLKTTADGKYVLIPQPSDSPRDPLNFSPTKKAFMLAAVAYIAALADYVGGSAIICVIPQAMCALSDHRVDRKG